jgi:hypothetical protein
MAEKLTVRETRILARRRVGGHARRAESGRDLDELHTNTQEVIGMLTEDGEPELQTELV